MTQINPEPESMFNSTLRCVTLSAPIFLIAVLLSACLPNTAMLMSPLPRSNGDKYKATATVLVDGPDLDAARQEASNTAESATGTGRATIVRASDGTEETFGVDDNIIVNVGDIITAWEGKTVITFFTGHTTTLTPVSKIKVVALSKSSGVETITLHQSLGSSSNHVDKSAEDEVEFDISTDSSIASVRGTDFNVQICGPEHTFYQTFTGSVDVNKDDERVALDAGHQLLATRGEDMEVFPLPVQAICGDERVSLEYPLHGQFVFSSTIPIYGTATHTNFDYWKLEYRPAAAQTASYSFLTSGEEPTVGAKLTDLDVSHLQSGEYTLRLMVVDETGNYPEPCSVNLFLHSHDDR